MRQFMRLSLATSALVMACASSSSHASEPLSSVQAAQLYIDSFVHLEAKKASELENYVKQQDTAMGNKIKEVYQELTQFKNKPNDDVVESLAKKLLDEGKNLTAQERAEGKKLIGEMVKVEQNLLDSTRCHADSSTPVASTDGKTTQNVLIKCEAKALDESKWVDPKNSQQASFEELKTMYQSALASFNTHAKQVSYEFSVLMTQHPKSKVWTTEQPLNITEKSVNQHPIVTK